MYEGCVDVSARARACEGETAACAGLVCRSSRRRSLFLCLLSGVGGEHFSASCCCCVLSLSTFIMII